MKYNRKVTLQSHVFSFGLCLNGVVPRSKKKFNKIELNQMQNQKQKFHQMMMRLMCCWFWKRYNHSENMLDTQKISNH